MLLKEIKQICVELGMRMITHLIFVHKYILQNPRVIKPTRAADRADETRKLSCVSLTEARSDHVEKNVKSFHEQIADFLVPKNRHARDKSPHATKIIRRKWCI